MGCWQTITMLATMETDRNMDISKKLVTLNLLSGTRVKPLTRLKVTNMFKSENGCSFIFDEVWKRSRSNCCQNHLSFKHIQNVPVCVQKPLQLNTFKFDYQDLQIQSNLLQHCHQGSIKWHGEVSSDTTARRDKYPILV